VLGAVAILVYYIIQRRRSKLALAAETDTPATIENRADLS